MPSGCFICGRRKGRVSMQQGMNEMHMKLVIIVLNKTECLQELLEEF